MNFVEDSKFWNVIGWIAFVLSVITIFVYFFVNANYTEAPTWLIAAVACWFYKDYLNEHKGPSKEKPKSKPTSNSDSSMEELERLAQMKEKGIITEEEFNKKKKELLTS